MIRIWNSYSPNNSSSCRLVARFADPRVAREAAVEIAGFLIADIGEANRRWIETRAAQELGARYGFTAADLLVWTSHIRAGDEPEIATQDGVLVIYHHYCLGFEHLTTVLEAKGALVEPEEYSRRPTISALFRRPATSSFDRELAEVLAHIDAPATKYRAPWQRHNDGVVPAAYFRDAGSVGLWMQCEPHELPGFEQWLADRGVERPSLRWCEDADEQLFRAIAKARCTACAAAVEYLDPRIHDIETPQFVCRRCGGLYDLQALT